MAEDDVVDARVTRGISLLTAHLNRDPSASFADEGLLRAVLGYDLTEDDVISALGDMLVAAELVMMSYQVKTEIRPIEVLREIATYREQRRDGE